MSQTSYDFTPPLGFPGMLADGAVHDIVGAKADVNSILVTPTPANTTHYKLQATFISNAGATYGASATEEVDYTSDSSATAAEISAGLVALINADALFPFDAVDNVGTLSLSSRFGSPAGTVASTGVGTLTLSAVNDDIPFGVMVAMSDGDSSHCKLPALASDVGLKTLGLALSTNFKESIPNDTGLARYLAGEFVNVLRFGRAWVLPEGAVSQGDPVWVRIAASGSNTQLGSLSNAADGTKQVSTITPTAVNSTEYQLVVDGHFYGYTSDSSATAAEIVTGFTSAINGDTGATVVASGTSTLILTAKVKGAVVAVGGDVNLAVSTAAGAAYNVLLPHAKFLTTAISGAIAKLQMNIT